MIPRTLHRILLPPLRDEGYVADYWRRLVDLHPGWEQRTWTEVPRDFEVYRLARKAKYVAQEADLLRLEILWRHGGVYLDTDCEPIRPLDELLGHGIFLGTEDGEYLTNSVIGAEPAHPAIRAYLDAVFEGFDPRQRPNETTGPHLATRVLKGRPDVTVLPRAAFYAEPWTARDNPDHRVEVADAPAEAFVIHRWAGSWDHPLPPTLYHRLRSGLALGTRLRGLLGH